MRTQRAVAIHRIACLTAAVLAFGSGYVWRAPVVSADSGMVLNEILARNTWILPDEDGEASDWIELVNAGGSSVDLAGYLIGDPTHVWRFPGLHVAPGGHVLVRASGKDRAGAELHTNFRIKAGEMLLFFDPSGELVDSVSVPETREDTSYGRVPSGRGTWRFFDRPTPGEPNPPPGYSGYAARPRFRTTGGFHDRVALVEIESDSAVPTLHYTLDGSEPSSDSRHSSTFVYSGPIAIAETTTLRVVALEPDRLRSRVVTTTYLVDFDSHGLPVVCISADPDALHGAEGLLGPENRDPDAERKAHVELFEANGRSGFALDAGIRLHGRSSRYYPQSSWAIFARDRYGPSDIEYRLFPDKPIDRFEAFLIRNNGQDNNKSLLRNTFVSAAVAQTRIDRLASRSVIVFINGHYAGIEQLVEKPNEHYVAGNHADVDPEAIDMLDGAGEVIHGDAIAHAELAELLADPGAWSREELEALVGERVDLPGYHDYVAAQLFFDNRDWTSLNEKLWRPRRPDGRWRWIFFDLDAVAIRADSTGFRTRGADFFETFMGLDRIRNDFLVTFSNHLNSTFREERLLPLLEQLASEIRPELPRHVERWGQVTEGPFGHAFPALSSVEIWESQIDVLRSFLHLRPAVVRERLSEMFGEGRENPRLTISLEPATGGRVRIADLEVAEDGWSGEYVHGVTVSALALSHEGFSFSHWLGADGVSESIAELRLDSDRVITAVFVSVEDLRPFVRGDANLSGDVDISDAVTILTHLFLEPGAVRCDDSADVDDNGLLDITDAINELGFLFLGSPVTMPPPFPGADVDRTADNLRCDG